MSASHVHKRVYQACEPCREKKVRCELGSADHPSQPPCARCSRERKECFFAASRIRKNASTKRKAESPLEVGFSRSEGPAPVSNETQLPPIAPNFGDRVESRSLPGDRHAAAALLEGHPRTYHDALTLLSEACEHSEGQKQNSDSGPYTVHPDIRPTHNEAPHTNNHNASATNTGTRDALQAWSSVRFVRGGLFTAEEALDMVDHFYTFHSAFSPVVPECFQDHSQHATLIEEEPILTITILMIGSRYRKWTGPAAVARSYIVHDRIWRYLQRMISRLFWSDDLFVGEFPSLRGPFEGRENTRPLHMEGWSHGFRTLGTCEALLLLLDWHPRALHFPPPDEDTSSIVVSEPKRPRKSTSTPAFQGPGSGHDWLARSDRLCYSMLSNVLMLATEIGIFNEEHSHFQDGFDREPSTEASDQQRFHRIQCLIWVYATQQPGRPGRKIPIHCTPVQGSTIKHDDATECWMRVATIMKKANELLFISPKYTEEIIRNGQYLQMIRSLESLLGESIVFFDNAKLAKQTRCILTIEYEYAELCIFSVALQAVINRNSGNGVSGRLERCPVVTSTEERKYLSCTVRAARTILKIVLDDLLSAKSLTYIPVRSYSRILGATLILLKCCAAGTSDLDISQSLDMVFRVAVGLRDSAVDDTHLSTRWGDLIEGIANRLQARLTDHSESQLRGINSSSSAAQADNYEDANDRIFQAQLSNDASIGQSRDHRPEINPLNIVDQVRSSNLDGKRDTHSDAWSMWWDDQFSQVNFNHMSWYPTLGLLDGSDPSFSSETAGNNFTNPGSLF